MISNRIRYLSTILLALFLAVAGCSDDDDNKTSTGPGDTTGTSGIPADETLYQVSTIDALLAGLYDGEMSYGDLKERGGFGLGTSHGLDGEMLAVDGVFYRIGYDGVAEVIPDTNTTPFAAVTTFDSDATITAGNIATYDSLSGYIDERLPTKNIFHAIKITGTFSYMKTRSVPKQEKPYPALLDVVQNQSVFTFENVSGTVVGFRCPPYVEGVNVPGYHLHFITDDLTAGGHVLELAIDEATVEIDYTHGFELFLSSSDDFYALPLSEEAGDLEEIE